MAGERVRYTDVDVSIPGQSGTAPTRSVFGWIQIHKHDDQESFDWNLNWASYRDGFENFYNFWFGLEKVHRLTAAQSYRLRVEIRDKNSYDWFSVEYSYFHVGPESDGYRLDVSGYNGDAYNALQYAGAWYGGDEGNFLHDGMKFSTWDQDNDSKVDDCTSHTAGAWWFNSCYMACLCCNTNHEWHSIHSADTHYLTMSFMYIKPQS